jgi:hypothetical protein
MHSDGHSFEDFWTAFSRELRPFRLGRACLSLALLTRHAGPARWRWALAAVALAAGKLLGGTFDEDLEVRETARYPGIAPGPADRVGDAPDLPTLVRGERAAVARPRTQASADAAWAAWM